MSGRSAFERVGRVTITHGDKKWTVELGPGVSTIGRDYEGSTNAVNLPADDLSCSRLHAEIENTGRSFLIRNRSANGTLVNGQTIQQDVELNTGDRVRVGAAEMLFAVASVPAGQAPQAPQRPVAPVAPPVLAAPDASGAPPAHIASAATTAEEDHDHATEAFDAEQLKALNLSAEQRAAIAAAKSQYDDDATTGLPAIPMSAIPAAAAAAPKAKAGYDIKESAAQAARTRAKAKAAPKAKEGAAAAPTNPGIFIAAGVAVFLLLILMVASPGSSAGAGSEGEIQALSAEYKQYLNTTAPGSDVDGKVAELKRRMQAIAWAEKVGRTDDIREQLNLMLRMDGDRRSPVYQYAAERIPNT